MPRDRPPPLKISRASNPHHHHHYQQRPFRPAAALRQPPVIIHTYSPEVIHIESDRFRQLVQHLTGPGSHTPPPPKRARLAVANPTPFRPALSPRGLRPPSQAGEAEASGLLLPSRLLSPLLFDFSPSVLPSPSLFPFDLPSLASPMGTRAVGGLPLPSPSGGLLWRSPCGGPATPLSLAAALPSPGPISAAFLADLPVLSPTIYSFIERNACTPGALPTPRFRLPPRPPPTTTATLFPQTSAPPLLRR